MENVPCICWQRWQVNHLQAAHRLLEEQILKTG
jgi:hypothetical protein